MVVVLRKAMRFVSHILQELAGRRVGGEADGLVLILLVDQFFLLGQGNQRGGQRSVETLAETLGVTSQLLIIDLCPVGGIIPAWQDHCELSIRGRFIT